MVGLGQGLGCGCCEEPPPWPPNFCTWYTGGDHDETFDPPYSRQQFPLREGWQYPIDPSSRFSDSWLYPGQLTLSSPFLSTSCPNKFLRPPLIWQEFLWKWHLHYHGFEYSFTYNLPVTALPTASTLFQTLGCVALPLQNGDRGMVMAAALGNSSNGVEIRHVYENDFINPSRWRVFATAFRTTPIFIELPLKTQYEVAVRNYREVPLVGVRQELYIDGVLITDNLRNQGIGPNGGACPGRIFIQGVPFVYGTWAGDMSQDMHIKDFKFRVI